jgi:hypothetical protein
MRIVVQVNIVISVILQPPAIKEERNIYDNQRRAHYQVNRQIHKEDNPSCLLGG